MRLAPLVPTVCAVACLAALPGCGDDTKRPAPRAEERTDAPAKLNAGWTRVVNRRSGFTLGLPPGWSARGSRGTMLIRSADRALAVGVSSDRSADGQTQPLRAYARATLAGLPGYRALEPAEPRPVKEVRYETVRATATGTFAKTGVRQAITLYAIRRPRQVTYSLLFFRSAKAPGAVYQAAIDEMIRTFRATPPEF